MRFVHAVAMVAVGVAISIQPAFSTSGEFSLTASPGEVLVHAGDQVEISVSIKNIGSSAFTMIQNGDKTDGELDYLVRIHDENGFTPSFSDFGKSVLVEKNFMFDGLSVTLQPGMSDEETIKVGKLFVLNPRHNYYVSFSAHLAGVDGPLRSNWVAITVR